ncbi:MAG: ABC transporter [Acidimicrobiales bacterium]|nr:MAG: ABC transporter [Acidimicrobiales bacterium]
MPTVASLGERTAIPAGSYADDSAVEARGLSKRFGTELAVAELNLRVPRGSVVALLGPNGAGKTTTVRLLNGVLRPDAGTATVLGLDPWSEGEAVRARTGVLTENAGLDDRLTVRENLWFVGAIRGIDPEVLEHRITDLLERLALGRYADQRTIGLSTGERKRVALARALLHDPEVLFLDEPTSGLDPAATRAVSDAIATMAREGGRTILLATHFLGEAGRIADRVAVLHRGRLCAEGTPAELASSLFPHPTVRVELGTPLDAHIEHALRLVPGVLQVRATDSGVELEVKERSVIPALVARLVASELPVYGVTEKKVTLEDIYFELQRRLGLDSGIDPSFGMYGTVGTDRS